MRKFTILSICLLIFTAVSAQDQNNPWERIEKETYFGLNGTKVFHIPNQMDVVDERIEWMHDAGVIWDRADWWWHVIEPEKGRFDFSVPDRILKHMEEKNIQIYPILCYGAAWFDGYTGPRNEEEIQDFADYVYKTVDRYKDHFTYWSVWNEPNIPNFWSPEPNPDNYARLMELTHKAAKKADPHCKLCAPVLAPLGAWDKAFTERLFQLGAMDWFDVFDYHYYRHHAPENEVPVELADIKAVMRRYGEVKPIWISETGVSGTKSRKPDYQTQASLVVRNHLLCFAGGVERIFYFDLQNWNDDETESWDSKLGLVEADGDKKPAYHAYQTLVKEVDFKKFIGRYRRPEEDLEAVLIYDQDRNEYILAAWLTREDEEKIASDIVCEWRDVKIVHPYGDAEIDAVKKPSLPNKTLRTISVELSRHPRYIHGVHPASYLPEAGVKLMPEKLYINPGEEAEFKVEADSLLKDAKISIVEKNLPEGVIWEEKKGVLKINEDAPEGLRTVSAMAEVKFAAGDSSSKKTRVEISSDIDILPVVKLDVRPYMQEDNLKVRATIRNQSPWDMKEAVELVRQEDSSEIAVKRDIELKAGQEKQLIFDVDDETVIDYEKPLSWLLKFGKHHSRPFKITIAEFSEEKPKIDGNLKEWDNIGNIIINEKSQMTRGPEGWSPEDSSLKAAFRFTPDSVCVAAEVTDDDPIHNPHPPILGWRGDTLELYLGFAGPAKRSVIDKKVDFQVGVAPTSKEGKPLAFLYHMDKVIEEAEVAAVKTEKGYNIEACIPLSVFGSPELKEGDFIGLDMALDDLDKSDFAPAGNIPGTALMWNGNGQNWINPSGWGMAILK